MELSDRIMELRQHLELSQEDFGKRIGLSRFAISNYESGKRNLPDRVLKDICREFSVDYFWLTEGIGEPFLGLPDMIIDDLVVQYGLDEDDRAIIMNYIRADKSVRAGIKTFIMGFTRGGKQ